MTITSPLRICGANPRYFEDGDGKPVVMVGSHTWNNLVDMGPRGAVIPFDWEDYLDFLDAHGHNFVRLWAFSSLFTWSDRDEVLTIPWLRTGPGTAADGRPRINFDKLDDAYFARLRERVASAQVRGIYVSVMLFDCWSNFRHNSSSLPHHLFAGGNNINGIDVLPSERNGVLAGWCMPEDSEVLRIQKAYVRRVVETVGDFDNVLYEICNEGGVWSHDWQVLLTNYIRELESVRAKQHPIGQTGGMGTSSKALLQGGADWISPDSRSLEGIAEGYRTGHYTFGSGPDEDGERPILLDTDHLWGVGGDVAWVWKSLCRGYNMLYMDPWNDKPSKFFVHPQWPAPADVHVRRELGNARRLAERLDLTTARPQNELSSSGYCLAEAGRQYLAFEASGQPFTLSLPRGEWSVTWHDPLTGVTRPTEQRLLPQPGTWQFTAPHAGPSVVLVEAVSHQARP
jgi:hypothetical protein